MTAAIVSNNQIIEKIGHKEPVCPAKKYRYKHDR
jgi:hypothetical protein